MAARQLTERPPSIEDDSPRLNEEEVERRWKLHLSGDKRIHLDKDTVAVIDEDSDDLLYVTRGGMRRGVKPYWFIRALCAEEKNWWPMVQVMLEELIDRGQGDVPLFWPRLTPERTTLVCADVAGSRGMESAAKNILYANAVQVRGKAIWRITPDKAKAALIAAGEWS